MGTLNTGMMKLRVGLHITKNEKGELAGTFDSIDQNARGIPVVKVSFEGNKLQLDMTSCTLPTRER